MMMTSVSSHAARRSALTSVLAVGLLWSRPVLSRVPQSLVEEPSCGIICSAGYVPLCGSKKLASLATTSTGAGASNELAAFGDQCCYSGCGDCEGAHSFCSTSDSVCGECGGVLLSKLCGVDSVADSAPMTWPEATTKNMPGLVTSKSTNTTETQTKRLATSRFPSCALADDEIKVKLMIAIDKNSSVAEIRAAVANAIAKEAHISNGQIVDAKVHRESSPSQPAFLQLASVPSHMQEVEVDVDIFVTKAERSGVEGELLDKHRLNKVLESKLQGARIIHVKASARPGLSPNLPTPPSGAGMLYLLVLGVASLLVLVGVLVWRLRGDLGAGTAKPQLAEPLLSVTESADPPDFAAQPVFAVSPVDSTSLDDAGTASQNFVAPLVFATPPVGSSSLDDAGALPDSVGPSVFAAAPVGSTLFDDAAARADIHLSDGEISVPLTCAMQTQLVEPARITAQQRSEAEPNKLSNYPHRIADDETKYRRTSVCGGGDCKIA